MWSSHLPSNPLPVFEQWMEHAWDHSHAQNPNAMALTSATVKEGIAWPSTRMVLVKQLNADIGYVVFYTNYQSRKAQELLSNKRACGLIHWDKLGRQVRIEGMITRSPADESDAYYASRDIESRLGAWTSDQSQPIDSRKALMEKYSQVCARFDQNKPIPRPPHWGGFRLWIDKLELWSEGAHRLHDRAVWQRELHVNDDQAKAGNWSVCRLQP